METRAALRFFRVLKKRWWLILLLMLSTVCSIMVAFYTETPVYRSSLKFLFTSPPTAGLTIYSDFRTPDMRSEISYGRANFIEILGSTSTVWQAMQTLGIGLSVEDVVVVVEPSEDSEIVRLIVEADDPQIAANMANALMDEALRTYGALLAKSTTMSHKFLSQQLDVAYAEWKQAQEKLVQFQIENGISDLQSALSSKQVLIRSLSLERDSAWVKGDLQAVAGYGEMIADREKELQDLIWLSSQYAELETDVKQAESVYKLLLSRETEAVLKENEILNVGFVSVLEPARPSSHPIPAFKPKIVLLGAVVSIAVGVFLAWGWEYLETQNVFDTLRGQQANEEHEPLESMA
jgi:succinoglycan biosynthesis transport protein ExoP